MWDNVPCYEAVWGSSLVLCKLIIGQCMCVLVFRQKLVKELFLLYFCSLCVLFFSVVCKIEAEETSILKC